MNSVNYADRKFQIGDEVVIRSTVYKDNTVISRVEEIIVSKAVLKYVVEGRAFEAHELLNYTDEIKDKIYVESRKRKTSRRVLDLLNNYKNVIPARLTLQELETLERILVNSSVVGHTPDGGVVYGNGDVEYSLYVLDRMNED